jgi:uncharacterized protein (DUF1684 family)
VGRFEHDLQEARHAKDEAFRYDGGSPLPPEERASFAGLSYFPPDPAWRVRATVTRLPGGDAFEMATSTGEPRLQRRAARLEFTTPEGPARLLAYVEPGGHDLHHGPPTYFVPFRDQTSGTQTYGAGRYLDLEVPAGDEAVVDFNLAYNPYCAYSQAYSCPLPPPENWLEIPVRAGEMQYRKENMR